MEPPPLCLFRKYLQRNTFINIVILKSTLAVQIEFLSSLNRIKFHSVVYVCFRENSNQLCLWTSFNIETCFLFFQMKPVLCKRRLTFLSALSSYFYCIAPLNWCQVSSSIRHLSSPAVRIFGSSWIFWLYINCYLSKNS